MINVLPFNKEEIKIIQLALNNLHFNLTNMINFENLHRRNEDCDTGYICYLYNLQSKINTVQITIDDYMDYFGEKE